MLDESIIFLNTWSSVSHGLVLFNLFLVSTFWVRIGASEFKLIILIIPNHHLHRVVEKRNWKWKKRLWSYWVTPDMYILSNGEWRHVHIRTPRPVIDQLSEYSAGITVGQPNLKKAPRLIRKGPIKLVTLHLLVLCFTIQIRDVIFLHQRCPPTYHHYCERLSFYWQETSQMSSSKTGQETDFQTWQTPLGNW